MTRAEEIAASLTKSEKNAMLLLSGEWKAGPELPKAVTGQKGLLDYGQLVDRRFGDMGEPSLHAGDGGLTVKLRACWHFRLNDLGLVVREVLQRGDVA